MPRRSTAKSKNAGQTRVDGQVFGEMRQRDPEFGKTFSCEEISRLLGIAADEIPAEWPIQIVSTGLPFAIVGLRSRETLANLKFSITTAKEFLSSSDAKFFYFVC